MAEWVLKDRTTKLAVTGVGVESLCAVLGASLLDMFWRRAFTIQNMCDIRLFVNNEMVSNFFGYGGYFHG